MLEGRSEGQCIVHDRNRLLGTAQVPKRPRQTAEANRFRVLRVMGDMDPAAAGIVSGERLSQMGSRFLETSEPEARDAEHVVPFHVHDGIVLLFEKPEQFLPESMCAL